MSKYFNFHMHTRFSDGKGEPADWVDYALKAGFVAVGFSEHAPLPFDNTFALKQERVKEYIKTIKDLSVANKGKIGVFCGLEMDFIPGISEDFASQKRELKLDYQVGSVHLIVNEAKDGLWFIDGPSSDIYDAGLKYLFGDDIRKAVKAYYGQINQMLIQEEFDVIGHFDKIKMHNRNRFFREDDTWYRDLVTETLELISGNDVIVEINTRGLYKKRAQDLFPGIDIVRQALALNIPLTLSSDAHSMEEMAGLFPETLQQLHQTGVEELYQLTRSGWCAVPLDRLIS